MTPPADDVALTVPQIVEAFGVSVPAVRLWIKQGRIKPVMRKGEGRGGTMYFLRGEVAALLFAVCPVCGERFKRANMRQAFCGQACRQRFNRAGIPKATPPPAAK